MILIFQTFYAWKNAMYFHLNGNLCIEQLSNNIDELCELFS